MQYVQLLECSSTLGNCCNDYGLITIIDITRKIFDLIQLVVPILLIVMITVQLVKMVVNPDDKKDTKKLINKVIATFICFFLPVIADVVVGLLPNNFKMSSCWENAKISREISANSPLVYIKVTDRDPYAIVSDASGYDKGDEKEYGDPNSGLGGGSSSSGGGSSSSTVTGTGAQRLISVAAAEIGNHESNGTHAKYESYSGLDTSQPWCAAFVTWCAGQAGFIQAGIIPSYVGCSAGAAWFQNKGRFHLEGSGYTPQPGDIVFYGAGGSQHTGIVERADANNIYTIEGNTSCEGAAQSQCGGSDGVSRKTRPRHTGYVYGYGTPAY